ncbi:DUF4350 domain-containing protein [Cryptosporangium aurantiacum]|uniref:DUF4350 domain-containing protein n=1 Tax=Cryptosporangium aurantiacum TaxID=134849 RepID=A0A1M7RNJ0_9ACTN|nr:DUF4350 domain-containing protein [Cryptosporangium aurantiacum]SHN47824.1 protein of unknown function [Cryptosporangium aurantiacum]
MITTAQPVVSARSPWRFRVGLTAVLAALIALAVWALISTAPSRERSSLDPEGAHPLGTRALAVLLGNHGHPVTRVTTVDEAMARADSGNVTVVVPFPYNLAAQSLRRLADLPDTVRVVFVQPDGFTLDDLEVGVEVRSVAIIDTVDPGCSLPEARSAGDAEMGGYRYAGTGLVRCYGQTLAVLDRPGKAELVFLGSPEPLINDRLAERGNAALSLGLLSAQRDVVWLHRTTPEPIAEDEARSLGDLLPTWVPATVGMLAAAGLLAAFWRGRRLSAPVAEPLPVIVRSTETVEGRARLYQRAHARPEATEALRGAALSRLLPLLGLGSRPEPREVCDAAAERSGWPAATVGKHLYGPPPTDDRGLVVLADALDALLAAVVSPAGPPAPADPAAPNDPAASVEASPDEGRPS